MVIRDRIKSNIKKLKNSGFIHIFSSSVINKIISLGSGIILVRILTRTEYGTYVSANNILGFFLLFTGFGATSGLLQMCCEMNNEKKLRNMYIYGSRVGLLFNVFLSISVLCVALFVELPISGANSCLLLMSFLPLAQLYPELQKIYLRANKENKKYSYANTFQSFVTFILACGLSLKFRAYGLVISHYISAVITAIFLINCLKVPLVNHVEPVDRGTKKAFFEISGISMLNVGVSQIMYLLDIFVLGLVVGESDAIASYKVATTIPTALFFIPAAIIVYIYPYFVEHRNDRVWLFKNYRRVIIGLGTFNFIVTTILFIFAPFFISLIFGRQYIDAVLPFRILCVSYFISGTFRYIAGNILVTQRRLKFNLLESVFSSGLNTLLNFLLIDRFYSVGAAMATLFTMIISSIISTIYLIKIFRRIGA